MPETKATAKALQSGIKLRIGEAHVVKVLPKDLARVRLTGMHFELNKAFLLPSAMPGIRGIKDTYDQHPGSNLLIVGHTDTSDTDEPNLVLSLERSDAMVAFLTDTTAPWEAFFETAKPVAKRWGIREIQMMLSAVPAPKNGLYKGKIDGVQGPETTKAIEDFQARKALKVDGIAGPVTRKALIEDYMGQDGTKLPKGITPVAHGAGESFPESKSGDGARDAEDRRVEIFVFDGPINPKPPADRKSRKDSKEYPAWLAQVTETVDFGPDAEGPDKLIIRLHDAATKPLGGAAFRVSIGSEVRQPAKADGDGFATIEMPAFCPESVTLEWGPAGSSAPFPFRQDILVECEGGSEETQARAKLNNIGYPFELGFENAVIAFQEDYQVDASPKPKGLTGGALPPATRKRLFDIYGALNLDASVQAG